MGLSNNKLEAPVLGPGLRVFLQADMVDPGKLLTAVSFEHINELIEIVRAAKLLFDLHIHISQ